MGVTSAGVGGIVALLGELRSTLGFSETAVGLIVSAGFLASFAAQVGLASYADRGHARRLVITGVAGAIAALVLMTVAHSVVLWVIARAAFGFAGGLILPGVRRAAAVADPQRVGENLGRLIVGEIGGFLIGPVAAGVLAEVGGIRLPFATFAVLFTIFLPFVWRLPADRGRIDTSGRLVAVDLLRLRSLQAPLMLIAAYFGLIGAFEAVVPVMYGDRGASALVIGLLFSTFAIPIVVISPRAGRLTDRVGPERVAITGITLVAASSSIYGVLPGYIIPACLMGMAGIGDAFGFTAVQAAVARAVPEERQAGALGLMGAAEVLAAGASAVPAAVLYDRVGAERTWGAVSAGTLSVIAVAVLLFRSAARQRASDQILSV
jgi:MFS family permease